MERMCDFVSNVNVDLDLDVRRLAALEAALLMGGEED